MNAVIELKLRTLGQLFNSLDPSPFHEKDLDHDAEEFIVGWARELPRRGPLELVVWLQEPLDTALAQETVEQAIRHYFAYRAQVTRRELALLLAQGRTSLAIGLVVLGAFLLASHAMTRLAVGHPGIDLFRESLLIGGWVAMWRPMEILLHDWWPVSRRRSLHERLAAMKVVVRPWP